MVKKSLWFLRIVFRGWARGEGVAVNVAVGG